MLTRRHFREVAPYDAVEEPRSVMGVVQVTVQSASGPRMLGEAAVSVQFSRSIGAAFGTATVAAVLFAVLAATDKETAALFGTMVEQGASVLSLLPP